MPSRAAGGGRRTLTFTSARPLGSPIRGGGVWALNERRARESARSLARNPHSSTPRAAWPRELASSLPPAGHRPRQRRQRLGGGEGGGSRALTEPERTTVPGLAGAATAAAPSRRDRKKKEDDGRCHSSTIDWLPPRPETAPRAGRQRQAASERARERQDEARMRAGENPWR
jgi:hypothetical protein